LNLPYNLTGNAFVDICIQVIFIIFYLAFIAFSIFQRFCKNGFYYQNHGQFGIRLNGKRTYIDTKFISEVSFDEDQQLQIRRINRVDTFDLSPFRKQDQDNVLRLLKDLMNGDMEILDKPILAS
jgi:hypothetical protein